MNKKLKSNEKITEDEIEFDDEIIMNYEEKEINAYISTENINLNKKFGLKYKEDSYYDIYLNYKYLEEKAYIEIVYVDDKNREYYIYNPTIEEQKMLIKQLKRYIKNVYKQSIKEFIEELEEWEKE